MGLSHLDCFGDELKRQVHTTVCGVVNVRDNHWVAITIDVPSQKILYGDSLGASRSLTVQGALGWWMSIHIEGDFIYEALPITQQNDTFSCGILAMNAVKHFISPSFSLISANHVAKECLTVFIAVVEDDNNAVESTLLFHCLIAHFHFSS